VLHAPSSEPLLTKTITREDIQVLGKVRTKAGRSNLPSHMRSNSMSCSDKIVLWGALGMQGGLLTKHLSPPIVPLHSVVISRDVRLDKDNRHNQLDALRRAISDRVAKLWDHLLETKDGSSSMRSALPTWKPPIPKVHLVAQSFESGKAVMALAASRAVTTTNHHVGEKRKREDEDNEVINRRIIGNTPKVSPCGMSLNWNQSLPSDLEVVIGARGIKHGRRPKSVDDCKVLASRLSRAKLLRDFWWPLNVSSTLHIHTDGVDKQYTHDQQSNADCATNHVQSYYQLKEFASCREWMEWKKRILSEEGGGPLAGWLRSVDEGMGDFNPHDSV
jgi:hypothetical protein